MTRRHYGYAAQVGGVLWLIAFVAGSLLPMPTREVVASPSFRPRPLPCCWRWPA